MQCVHVHGAIMPESHLTDHYTRATSEEAAEQSHQVLAELQRDRALTKAGKSIHVEQRVEREWEQNAKHQDRF